MLSFISLDVNYYCVCIVFLQKYSSQRGSLQYQEMIYLIQKLTTMMIIGTASIHN